MEALNIELQYKKVEVENSESDFRSVKDRNKHLEDQYTKQMVELEKLCADTVRLADENKTLAKSKLDLAVEQDRNAELLNQITHLEEQQFSGLNNLSLNLGSSGPSTDGNLLFAETDHNRSRVPVVDLKTDETVKSEHKLKHLMEKIRTTSIIMTNTESDLLKTQLGYNDGITE